MDLARSRRYLKAVGVVLWRPRDSFDAELETFAEGEVSADLESGNEMALPAAPPTQGHASTTGLATPAAASSTSGLAGMAAARAALGAGGGTGAGNGGNTGTSAQARHAATRSSQPPTPPPTPTQPAPLPPDTPIASARPPVPSGPATGSPAPPPAQAPNAADAQAIAAMDWPTLETEVSQCRRCGLCERRSQTVFGVGNRQARLMLIGEAPGEDEDRQGEPFVGRAGQLLTRMLAAIDLPREQVYIGNIIKCRPPGNRDPLPEETAICRAFIERQIALVAPQLLLCLGRISAQALLQTGDALWRLRGRWHSFGPERIPLLVTYHPSYYLRTPAEKARGWEDLQQVARRLRDLYTETP
ncbi:uracil-DNA glycosylase [Thiorhodovibrio frisius]|uniref:Type-4 uracil-DNA glycosylase n=1 Tax=Thiorhodovibrio frisius TaxID=631362 RepID=H8YYZ5_9GAMM|nr:uracil-DNA glycosylase [Thiorhodovibrio frisius]EIC21922.1 uracil-DNA glycosylase, family 4 [Thiorhodovibrio frisius]WPL24211.1 uracil-DNA glycosylase, family 4 [Thiorhodovibrio frisius]